MPTGPAARVSDPVAHPLPPGLSPGPGSPTVLIGALPAWRGLPLSAVGSLQMVQQAGEIAIRTAEATTVAAAGTPVAPAAYAAEQALKASTLASISSAIASASGGADIHGCLTPSPLPPHGPGVVFTGSSTVMINGLPACRMGDSILEAIGPPSTILMGLPTVIIGDVGMGMGSFGQVGGVNSPVQALATRRPTAAEIQEIQDALDAGNRQRAADLAVRYYGIDTANVPGGVRYDATVADYGVTSFDGRIRLGPTAFTSPEVLASTIAHETTHSNQAAATRASDPTLTDWPDSTADYDEAVAYDTEVRSAHQTGLESNPAEFEIARSRRETHNGNLSADDQADYGNGGYPP